MTTIDYWTYEADTFCNACAAERFGDLGLADTATVDRFGNPIGPVFSTDEGSLDEEDGRFRRAAVHCGSCGDECREAGEWQDETHKPEPETMHDVLIPFCGFYGGTVAEWNADYVVENAFSDSSGNINAELYDHAIPFVDWQSLYRVYAEAYAESFLGCVRLKGEFAELSSPREYNFSTDRIFVRMPQSEIVRMVQETDRDILDKTARKWFTSRSGFASFYDADYRDWDWSELDHNQLGCILAAYLETHGFHDDDSEEGVHESLGGNCCIYADAWITDSPELYRLLRIADYLREREDRQWRRAA